MEIFWEIEASILLIWRLARGEGEGKGEKDQNQTKTNLVAHISNFL